MSNPAIEIMVTGRLVGGHPMDQRVVIDDKTNQPKKQADGVTPRTEAYIGIAIPKGAETHWNQTEWGQQFMAAATRDWPNGEHAAASFAFKVIDGDSQIPNKRGNKPADREGYPGHWVINASTGLAIKCFHANKYDPHEQIQDKGQIKCGDYCRVLLNVRGNGPSQSPGIYVNPTLFELSRVGVEIIVETGTTAAAAFGGQAPQPHTPANGATITPPAQQAPAPGTIAPAPEFLTPPPPAVEVKYLVSGQQYTAEQLRAAGWNDQQLAAAQTV